MILLTGRFSMNVILKLEFSNGEWSRSEYLSIELTDRCSSDLQDYVEQFQDKNGHEWKLIDYSQIDIEGFYEEWNLSEFRGLDEFGEFADLVSKYGEAFEVFYDDTNCDEGCFNQCYLGCWESFYEYANNYFDSCMNCPDNLRKYIDIDSFAEDLSCDYSTYRGNQGIHVFCN